MSEDVARAPIQTRTGGCLCKNIRFTVTGQPHDPHICACKHCAHRGGAPFMWWVGFPVSGLSWTGPGGEPKWIDTYAGKTKRGFCPDCGSHVAATDYGDVPFIDINATALDDWAEDLLLVPVNLNRLQEAAFWLAQATDAQRETVG